MNVLSKAELLSELQPYQGEPIPVKMVFDDLLLVIASENVFLIGEKFGSWQIFESISRADIQKVEVKDNFLGEKIVIVSKIRRYELKDIPEGIDLAKLLQVKQEEKHLAEFAQKELSLTLDHDEVTPQDEVRDPYTVPELENLLQTKSQPSIRTEPALIEPPRIEPPHIETAALPPSQPVKATASQEEDSEPKKSGCSGCFSIFRIAFILYIIWQFLE